MVLQKSDAEWANEWERTDWSDPKLVKLRTGPWELVERYTEHLIQRSMDGDRRHSTRDDIITTARAKRIYHVESLCGIAQAHVRLGMFRRVANPQMDWLNSRDGIAQFYKNRH